MPEYKLVYFNARGRAELIRWVFKVAGVEFEDYRIKKGGWTEHKPAAPFLQTPTLGADGKVYCQSISIARYIADKYGLGGDTLEDKAMANMIVDCCQDLGQPATNIFKQSDPQKKSELLKKYCDEQLPTFMKNFEKLFLENKGSVWFIGDKLTWADLAFVIYTGSWLGALNITPEWEKFPHLKQLKERVESMPAIKQWITERPKTSF